MVKASETNSATVLFATFYYDLLTVAWPLRTRAAVSLLASSHTCTVCKPLIFFELFFPYCIFISPSGRIWTNLLWATEQMYSCCSTQWMLMRIFPLGFIFITSRMEWLQTPPIPTGRFHGYWHVLCLYLILVYLHQFSSLSVYFTQESKIQKKNLRIYFFRRLGRACMSSTYCTYFPAVFLHGLIGGLAGKAQLTRTFTFSHTALTKISDRYLDCRARVKAAKHTWWDGGVTFQTFFSMLVLESAASVFLSSFYRRHLNCSHPFMIVFALCGTSGLGR